nr:MAG TPA: PilA, PilC, PilN, PilO, PilM, pilus, ring, membrane channel [Caudoviricetes sp.]
MSERIIVALIGVLGTFAGSFFTNRKSMALIMYRLEQLEEKVNKHNNLIDRMYKAETNIEVIQEEVNNLRK